jgi:hypothetical protein
MIVDRFAYLGMGLSTGKCLLDLYNLLLGNRLRSFRQAGSYHRGQSARSIIPCRVSSGVAVNTALPLIPSSRLAEDRRWPSYERQEYLNRSSPTDSGHPTGSISASERAARVRVPVLRLVLPN